MNSERSHKIIVASGLAVVVGIGVVTFKLNSRHPTSAGQIAQPSATVAPTPAAVAPPADAPAAVAPAPEPPAAAAQIPDAPAAAHKDSVGAKNSHTADDATVEPKVASTRHRAKAPSRAHSSARAATPAEPPAADSREKSAGETPAKSTDGVKSVDEVTTTPDAGGTTTFSQQGAVSTDAAAADSKSPPK